MSVQHSRPVLGAVRPTRDEFAELAADRRVIPVTRTLLGVGVPAAQGHADRHPHQLDDPAVDGD